MTDVRLSPQELSALRGIALRAVAEMRAEIKSLDSQAGATLQEGWRGLAAQKFRADWEQWRDDMNKLLETMDGLSEMMATVGAVTAAVDQDSAGAVRRASGPAAGPIQIITSPTKRGNP
jgi:WXG100 family type VII secretion target